MLAIVLASLDTFSALSAHSASTKQAVSNALNAGMEVSIHERPITIDGWTGAGYTKIDPNTGAGGYMIDGGGNGGILQDFAVNGLVTVLSTILEGFGKFGKILSGIYAVVDHIKTIWGLVFADCSTGQKIAGIISVTILAIGFLLMAPAFAVFGLLAAIIYALVAFSISSAVAYGWNSVCK